MLADMEPPTIVCPANVEQHTDADICTSFVALVPPISHDNSGQVEVVCSHESSAFPVGVTTVTCIATDPSNNQAECDYNITIVGMSDPHWVIIALTIELIIFPAARFGASVDFLSKQCCPRH